MLLVAVEGGEGEPTRVCFSVRSCCFGPTGTSFCFALFFKPLTHAPHRTPPFEAHGAPTAPPRNEGCRFSPALPVFGGGEGLVAPHVKLERASALAVSYGWRAEASAGRPCGKARVQASISSPTHVCPERLCYNPPPTNRLLPAVGLSQDKKADMEEDKLSEIHPAYKTYKDEVSKFVPTLY